MWFYLQDSTGSFELNRQALRDALGPAGLEFLAPRGDSWDAPLDDTRFPEPALPPFHFSAPAPEEKSALAKTRPVERGVIGSNAFAIAGGHTATGAALLANDMHLGLSVPHIWYRAVLQWSDGRGPHRLAGVMLPGTPMVIAGSNGHIAWGFTDAYVDTSDVIMADTDSIAQKRYRTSHGWRDIEERSEQIAIKGDKPEAFVARWTDWGPIIGGPNDGRYQVLRWTAHDAEATNLKLMELETAATSREAVDIAHRSGVPNENFIVADADGHIAWTIVGLVPRRVGYDGRLPVSWAYGDRRWDGWLRPEEIPVVFDPTAGALWSGNQRMVGGTGYGSLGDSGYDEGARAGQIRDDLRALLAGGKPVRPVDLFTVELDDRARFLERWQQLLLEVLDDSAVAQKAFRGELREAVRGWDGTAGVDSAAYRIVRAFRLHAAERVLAPFAAGAGEKFTGFDWHRFLYEGALWRLTHDQPEALLNPAHSSWKSLLLAAADDVLEDIEKAGVSPTHFTWGSRNTLVMRHPFSRFLPGPVAKFLDMPAVPLPGDNNMPLVQDRSFGQSERLVVAPGHEDEGLLVVPGGQSGHPLSPYYRSGQDAWAKGETQPLLPGPVQHTLTLTPQ
jgi:penicillin amidase